MEVWLEKESQHYIFHFKKDSYASQFVDAVILEQEQCFENISRLLQTVPRERIHYWLCDSQKEVALKSKYGECNGVTCCDDGVANIYCVYTENVKCTGYHEDTHAIAYFYNDIHSNALAEGLAMYMDKTWWSIENELCTLVYIENGVYVSVEKMICGKNDVGEEYFLDIDDCYSYPIMGAFVAFLIEQQGTTSFLRLYGYKGMEWETEFAKIYGRSIPEAENEFIYYIKSKEYTEPQTMAAYTRLCID